jgi:hypothetical protein
MRIEKYALKAESSLTVFEFISEGPNRVTRELIYFPETNEPGVYTLAFGDEKADPGELDDLTISNYNDRGQVLATVIAAEPV